MSKAVRAVPDRVRGEGRAGLPPVQRRAPVARIRRAVATALDRGHVLDAGETVVVACSGGPDSTTLLDALIRLAPPRRLRLIVVHVDHRLRAGSGAEAGRVAAQAAAAGLEFHSLAVTVGAGASLQAQARHARHTALADIARRVGAGAIALGHTADDQAETVLMRALTGATPRSLAAMRPRERRLRRPLLGVWRADVDAYCRALGLDVADDPSNRDPRFLRTRVRHEILPVLEDVFPGARRRLAVLAGHQQALLDALAGDVFPPSATRRPVASGHEP